MATLQLPFQLSAQLQQGLFPRARLLVSLDDYQTLEPTWVDLSDRIYSWESNRGRNSELELFDAGTLSVVLDNRDGFLRPEVTPNLTPMNRVKLSLEWDGVVYPVFTGYAQAWQQDWPSYGGQQTTLSAADEFAVLSRLQAVISGVGTVPALSIDSILDLGGPNRAPRALQVAVSTGTIFFSGDSVALLDLIQQIEQGDIASLDANAAFFIAADGTATYLSAEHRDSDPYATPQATYADDGSGLPYLDLTTDYSDSFLFNSWTVTGSDGVAKTATTQESIARYGQRDQSRSVLQHLTDNVYPVVLAAKYSSPFQRVTSISPDLSDADTCSTTLGLELMYKIEVIRTPLDGQDAIDAELFVQSIRLTGEQGTFPTCTLGVSPL